jgi:outer membrane protein insertion porin family
MRLTPRAAAFLAALLASGGRSVAQIDGYTPTNPASSVPQTATPAQNVVIRSVRLVGTRSVSDEDLRRAAEFVALGKPGDAEAVRAAATAVTEVYRERRYTLAQVIDVELTPGGVLTLTVAEGVIRRVVIEGNGRTRQQIIERSLSLRPGEVFNEGKADADRQRLARLGIFADVKVGPELNLPDDEKAEGAIKRADGNAPKTLIVLPDDPPLVVTDTTDARAIGPVEDRVGQVDLVVRVRETQTVNIAATVGYADGMGAVGFVDLSENNLFGLAHRTSLQWQRTSQAQLRQDGSIEPGDSRSAFSFAYEVPTLGPRGVGYGVELYDKNTVFLPAFAGGQETLRSYERRRGFTAEVGRPVTNNLALFLTVRRDEVGYDPLPDRLNPPAADLAAIADSFGTVGAFGVMALLDGRDNVENPRVGYRHSLAVERSATGFLGGDRTFTQVRADFRGYIPLTRITPQNAKKPGPVLALRLLGGTSTGDVPLSEQFFLGGFELLRGYELFSIRGDRALLGTAELRLPLGEGLQGVVFTDVGNAWRPGRAVSPTDLKAAIGAGIRFLSPIGPIRFDAAFGSRFQTYVSLGQSF